MIRFLRWVIVWRHERWMRRNRVKYLHGTPSGQFLNHQRRTMDYPGRYL